MTLSKMPGNMLLLYLNLVRLLLRWLSSTARQGMQNDGQMQEENKQDRRKEADCLFLRTDRSMLRDKHIQRFLLRNSGDLLKNPYRETDMCMAHIQT